MRWLRTSAMFLCAGLLACGDASNGDAANESETAGDGDGDGEPGDGDGDGDGDGEPGDGDGEPGDGDGESGDGDGDGEPGDGDGDGEPGDGDGDGEPGDGDGDGEPGDGDGESGDGDGDELCDPAGFVGHGIAEDGWGVGDSCDEIYVCVSNLNYDALIDLLELPEENCMSDLVCGDGQRCTLSNSTTVDQELYEQACAALTLVNEVACVIWGP